MSGAMRCAYCALREPGRLAGLWLLGLVLFAAAFGVTTLVVWTLSVAWKWAVLAAVGYTAWRVTSLARRAVDRWRAARDHLSQRVNE